MATTRSLVFLLVAWLGALGLGARAAAQAAPADSLKALGGQWAGTIQIPGAPLRVVVRFTDGPHTIDIPDQGARGLALTGVSLQGDKLRFAIQGVLGQPTFEGNVAGEEIAGTFTQGGQGFPFTLKRAAPQKRPRPQDPQPPFPYLEEAIQARNGAVSLDGTLTRPKGDGPFPAVVLISGSGPQNRDSELFDHRPFLVLADALTRAGVLVVRYDDRGVGKSTGSREGATMRTYASDAGAFVSLLKKRPDVSVVGLIGHSEGGQVAPMLAADNRDVGFVALLAASGVSGDRLMVEQNRALALAGGASAEQAEAIAQAARALFDAAKRGESQARLIELVRALAQAQTGAELPPEAEASLVAQAQGLREPWFREFLSTDPAVDLRRLSVPVLAINGSKDTQVVASQNLPAIRDALKTANNPDVTVKELAGLNHLFQTAGTGGVDEYGRLDETLSPVAIELITTWIRERFVEPAR
jgi:pimeloyl-ACP methyl ester carboxylesterase